MNRKLMRSAVGMLALACAGMPPARAETTNYLWPRFAVTAGSYRIDTDDSIRIDVSAQATGTEARLEEDFGLPDSESLTTLGFEWGFAARHSLDFKYYDLDREGSRTISRTITIRDVEFPVGASLDASFGTTSIEGAYNYWFVRRDELGVAASLGLVYLDLGASMTGTAVFGSSGATETRSVSASTDLPVPMIGLAVKGSPWRRVVLFGSGRYLPAVQIGDIDGEAGSYKLGADWYLIGAFALGASYDGTFYKIDVDQSRWRGSVDLASKGWNGYVRASF
jgi:hypothetical protein